MKNFTTMGVRKILENQFSLPYNVEPFVLSIRGGTPEGDSFTPSTPDGIGYKCSISAITSIGFFTLPATTEPGMPWRKNPISAAGCGFVAEGAWRYRKGLHKGKYPALEQAGAVAVWRDLDRNMRITHNEDSLTVSASSFNVHQSWSLGSIGKDSAGCIVAQAKGDDPRWKRFLGSLHNNVTLVLVRYELLHRAANDPTFRCLMHGSRMGDVPKLQKHLGLVADGVFGLATMAAVREFQRVKKIRPDGIAGPDTLKAMGL